MDLLFHDEIQIVLYLPLCDVCCTIVTNNVFDKGRFCNMPDSKNTDKSKAGFFFHVKGEREADGGFGSYECKGSKGALYFAGQGIQQQWVAMKKREMQLPQYTTRDEDLLRVK